jgi:hypothetical protein
MFAAVSGGCFDDFVHASRLDTAPVMLVGRDRFPVSYFN